MPDKKEEEPKTQDSVQEWKPDNKQIKRIQAKKKPKREEFTGESRNDS